MYVFVDLPNALLLLNCYLIASCLYFCFTDVGEDKIDVVEDENVSLEKFYEYFHTSGTELYEETSKGTEPF